MHVKTRRPRSSASRSPGAPRVAAADPRPGGSSACSGFRSDRHQGETANLGHVVGLRDAGPRPERLGDYRILREIGRGGMGVVYEAEQGSLGRRVALKVLSATSLLDPKQVARFEREARAAGRLHHTNIVPVFGVGEHDGTPYYVMQFIAGLGLDAVIAELRRLPGEGRRGSGVPAAGTGA